MAKIIKYVFLSCEVNHGTEDQPQIEKVYLEKELRCRNQAEYDVSYPIAEKEAVGEIQVEGDFDAPELSQEERIADLEEALELLLSGVTE